MPWRRTITPNPVLLFRFSALTFNSHRIHYDHEWATKTEGYPALVVHGPLTSTLLADFARDHAGGRPIKVEGNPQHPASLQPAGTPAQARFGPADRFAQASTLTFYDPDRSQAVMHLAEIRSWDAFALELQRVLRSRGGIDFSAPPVGFEDLAHTGEVNRNLRIRILTGAVTSPSLADRVVCSNRLAQRRQTPTAARAPDGRS